MLKTYLVASAVALTVAASLVVPGLAQQKTAPAGAPPQTRPLQPGQWPEARGATRDGSSPETGLLSSWKLNGENFLWRAPYGGRSAPVVLGNRVYVQNPAGRGAELQERVMALDADSGKVVWEYKFNLFQSDAPPHRIGWASPAADPHDRKRVRVERWGSGHRTQFGRQAALDAIVR